MNDTMGFGGGHFLRSPSTQVVTSFLLSGHYTQRGSPENTRLLRRHTYKGSDIESLHPYFWPSGSCRCGQMRAMRECRRPDLGNLTGDPDALGRYSNPTDALHDGSCV